MHNGRHNGRQAGFTALEVTLTSTIFLMLTLAGLRALSDVQDTSTRVERDVGIEIKAQLAMTDILTELRQAGRVTLDTVPYPGIIDDGVAPVGFEGYAHAPFDAQFETPPDAVVDNVVISDAAATSTSTGTSGTSDSSLAASATTDHVAAFDLSSADSFGTTTVFPSDYAAAVNVDGVAIPAGIDPTDTDVLTGTKRIEVPALKLLSAAITATPLAFSIGDVSVDFDPLRSGSQWQFAVGGTPGMTLTNGEFGRFVMGRWRDQGFENSDIRIRRHGDRIRIAARRGGQFATGAQRDWNPRLAAAAVDLDNDGAVDVYVPRGGHRAFRRRTTPSRPREIVYRRPLRDAAGRIQYDANGDMLWEAAESSFLLRTDADGLLRLDLMRGGVRDHTVCRGVESLYFETSDENGTLSPNQIRVVLTLAKRKDDGTIEDVVVDTVVAMRNIIQ